MGAFKVVLMSILVLMAGIAVQRLLREPLKQKRPDWRNFGKLSDVDVVLASEQPPQSFKIKVTEEEENDFKRRVGQSRLPPILDEQVNMTYGFPSRALPELRDLMLHYDLQKWARTLNRYNHYKTKLFGLDIHYVRVNGTEDLPRVPLLLIHGWPGSFYEFYSAIPLLLKKAADNGFTYDVIIPSLPGYGFSEPAYHPGCSPRYAAAMFNELMTHKLGYKRYVVQGGDWGSFVAEWIVGYFPENVLGFHVNMFSPPPVTRDLRVLPYQMASAIFPTLLLSEDERTISDFKGNFAAFKWLLLEGGYFHLQATKPDSLGVGLTDSPLGLAAYILEKFYTWTDGTLVKKPIDVATSELPFSIDDLLRNILVYWHTNSIQSSMRLYREALQEFDMFPFETTDVPSGILFTKHEITFSPLVLVKLKYTDLRQHKISLHGGHFAAFEIPEILSDEIVAFTKQLDHQ